MAAQQLQAGVPIVVPAPLSFEGIDAGWIWTPAAVMMHGLLEGTPVTSGHIPDDAVDVKQQSELAQRLGGMERLVG